MRACLLQHQSELSQTCKNAMKVVHSKAKGPNGAPLHPVVPGNPVQGIVPVHPPVPAGQ